MRAGEDGPEQDGRVPATASKRLGLSICGLSFSLTSAWRCVALALVSARPVQRHVHKVEVRHTAIANASEQPVVLRKPSVKILQ